MPRTIRRSAAATFLAAAAALAVSGTVFAEPVSEPASCAGYLAAWASPNNGWIIHNIVMPAADELGVTVGQLTASNAARHAGSLEACIPE